VATHGSRQMVCRFSWIPGTNPGANDRGYGGLMRRLFADRVVLATAVAVILMSIVFALLRVAGF
jgi:hypothetical protein